MNDDELCAALANSDVLLCQKVVPRIRALIAERDEARGWAQHWQAEATEDGTALRAAEAEVARLRRLLRDARDALTSRATAYSKSQVFLRIDAALATEDTP